MLGLDTLKRDAPQVENRIEYIPDAGLEVIRGINCGVFFVMAWWSGPARAAFAELGLILAALDPAGELRLVVADTDRPEALTK